MTKITFIGAGSTIFMKNIVGDALHFPALADARFALIDIDPVRLEESGIVAKKLIEAMEAPAVVETYSDQRAALEGAEFVVVAFQIGGYKPCTVTDFEIPRQYGLRQTIGDTLGIGGIMRGLRTVPHLWKIAADMAEVCPDALMLQYVNPMAINTWALAERYPNVRQVGLCHSVQNTLEEFSHDLGVPVDAMDYHVAGVNHVAFFLHLHERLQGGGTRDLYPALRAGYAAGTLPNPPIFHDRCPNTVRYEVMKHLGYFCTESSEHLAEYVPWFIKAHRPDLIETFGIPLDEYPTRCEEQIAAWASQAEAFKGGEGIDVEKSHEFAADMMNAAVTNEPFEFYGNLANTGQIPQLPMGAAVETPCVIDASGIRAATVTDIPPQLVALMRTQINVQELTVRALLDENIEHIHHAAMMDPHTAAELDLGQIRAMVDDLLAAHGDWLPAWARRRKAA
ncbi:MAG: alpha-glucosidase/alpha-galactosidase [Silicimonas sp.]|nr:alpha-glucosidase/alpha-galactosidase [Silicimonas sp.]